ncbi:MAG: Unknown protein [uncultured Sulfurovum sp.]|uniref:Uncharacterized protein n=1 Tax=uncultured Sulfurovum sp. TaxID=269237 RepID=A0A6S6TZG0_9BACT|nr:MAG: Unknown protein [uncultured Sulfurovum sp.]
MYKMLLTILLLLSSLNAIELRSSNTSNHGNFNTWIQFEPNEQSEAVKNQDWIAIYKKDAPTSWENVLHWSWVKDLSHDFVVAPRVLVFPARDLEEGSYEVRYFKNNSYTIEDSIDMVIAAHDSYVTKITIRDYSVKNSITVSLDGFSKYIKPNEKDWIAIYKKGSTNDWENVIKWKWARDLKYSNKYWEVKVDDLEAGDYEVRFFLNNSYTTHVSSSFTVNKDENVKEVFEDKIINATDNYYVETVNLMNPPQKPKDWIALFKEGAERTKENVVAWSDNIQSNYGFIRIYDLPYGRYDLVYFLEDSYEQYGESSLLSKQEG